MYLRSSRAILAEDALSCEGAVDELVRLLDDDDEAVGGLALAGALGLLAVLVPDAAGEHVGDEHVAGQVVPVAPELDDDALAALERTDDVPDHVAELGAVGTDEVAAG